MREVAPGRFAEEVAARQEPYVVAWIVRGSPFDTYRLEIVQPAADAFNNGLRELGDDGLGFGARQILRGTQP